MYLGGADSMGLLYMFYEVCDNCVDEAMAGRCGRIDVVLHEDGSISVEDDGPGLPINHAELGTFDENYPSLDRLLTDICRKNWIFSTKLFEGYHSAHSSAPRHYPFITSGSMHGTGLGVVSMLSAWIESDTRTPSGQYTMRFERGVTTRPVTRLADPNGTTGTRIHWLPDREIFKDAIIDPALVRFRIRELAHLNPGLRLTLLDCRSGAGEREVFCSPNGMQAFVMDLCFPERPMGQIVRFASATDGIAIDGALTYVHSMRTSVHFYANMVPTTSGKHESGFYNGITRALNFQRKLLGEDSSAPEPITRTHTRTGLVGALSVKLARPLFEGATKSRLVNPEVYDAVFAAVASTLETFFTGQPATAKSLLSFCTRSWGY